MTSKKLPEAIPVEFDIVMIDQRERFLTFIATDDELPGDVETQPWRIDQALDERRRENMINALWASHERYLGGVGCISDEDACSRFLTVFARCNDWAGSYSRRSVQFIP